MAGIAKGQDPTPIPVIGVWGYAGCAQETPLGRTLNGASTSGNMTAEKCLNYCTSQDYGLAGMEYGNECFCGNSLMNGATYNNTGCNMACTGDSSQVCGGADRLTVYADSTFVPPQIVPGVGSYASQGCYTEGTNERALSGFAFSAGNMTAAVCVAGCEAKSFSLAGVEYSTECWCGNTLSNQSISVPDTECDMKCGGDKKSFCGGPNRLVLYKKIEVSRFFHRSPAWPQLTKY
ncbi:WSC domain-containing protein [Sphaerosporella brunnea]|uniref:WSC domain-containing protein n=1 Tax=Sphaerosporella brunnea TaxID=1250544 RepID=A0A5J5EJL5_9PEZI|nr:WSC domain-containing protein [Sphaerosporella brunnea]